VNLRRENSFEFHILTCLPKPSVLRPRHYRRGEAGRDLWRSSGPTRDHLVLKHGHLAAGCPAPCPCLLRHKFLLSPVYARFVVLSIYKEEFSFFFKKTNPIMIKEKLHHNTQNAN